MMTLSKKVVHQIFTIAKKNLPEETCGLLAGTANQATHYFPITNSSHGEHRYSFDPKEQLLAVKEAKYKGLEILAILFTHAHTEAFPTEIEINLAFKQDIKYVIFSLADELQDVRAYLILEGSVSEELIMVE